MGLNFFFGPLTFGDDLNNTDLFTWVCQNETFLHAANCGQAFGIGTSFDGLEDSEIGEIEDKDFGLKDDDTAIGFDFDGFDLTFAAGFDDAFELG